MSRKRHKRESKCSLLKLHKKIVAYKLNKPTKNYELSARASKRVKRRAHFRSLAFIPLNFRQMSSVHPDSTTISPHLSFPSTRFQQARTCSWSTSACFNTQLTPHKYPSSIWSPLFHNSSNSSRSFLSHRFHMGEAPTLPTYSISTTAKVGKLFILSF